MIELMFIYTLLSLMIECQRDQLSGWFAWMDPSVHRALSNLINFLISIV